MADPMDYPSMSDEEFRQAIGQPEKGVEIQWCEAHASNLEFRDVHGNPQRCSHAWANDFDNCQFVPARVCIETTPFDKGY